MRTPRRWSLLRGLTRGVLLGTLAFAAPTGCKQHGPPLPTGQSPSTSAGTTSARTGATLGVPRRLEGKELRGRVLFGGKQFPVKSIVGQNARMDLQTNCRAALEAAKKDAAKKGKTVDVPLCFRPGYVSKVTEIRVDFDDKGDGAKAFSSLRLNGEAAHFLIEASGSTYQLMDMAVAPRRSGDYRGGEIRIMSANAKTHEALVASLRDLLGRLPVDIVQKPFRIPVDAAPPKSPKRSTP